ncbi:MAG: GNAT family N-acetyltransferase [Planctomycetes bacterium]|nr:GNAT family N-acetyltransferase [Planctomycetota bacterium]
MPDRPTSLPTLTTPRLTLRPFAPADAADVSRLAGAREVAQTMLYMPHPYDEGMAERWIASLDGDWAAGRELNLAMTLAATGELIGSVGLSGMDNPHQRAELGYWVGVPYWGRGYCTEAARGLIRYAFAELGLHRVFAHHFTRNPASGRVLAKAGMTHEGTLRKHALRWGVFEDREVWGILATDSAAGENA